MADYHDKVIDDLIEEKWELQTEVDRLNKRVEELEQQLRYWEKEASRG